MESKGNLVRVSGLSAGRDFDRFEYGDDFLRKIDDFGIKGGHLVADVVFERSDIGAEISFEIKGELIVACDRCGDDTTFKVELKDTMPVRVIGDEEIDGTEDIIYVRKDENFIDIDVYVEELVKLSVPIRIVHENEDDCNPEVIKLLMDSESIQTQSHWDALKNLKK